MANISSKRKEIEAKRRLWFSTTKTKFWSSSKCVIWKLAKCSFLTASVQFLMDWLLTQTICNMGYGCGRNIHNIITYHSHSLSNNSGHWPERSALQTLSTHTYIQIYYSLTNTIHICARFFVSTTFTNYSHHLSFITPLNLIKELKDEKPIACIFGLCSR